VATSTRALRHPGGSNAPFSRALVSTSELVRDRGSAAGHIQLISSCRMSGKTKPRQKARVCRNGGWAASSQLTAPSPLRSPLRSYPKGRLHRRTGKRRAVFRSFPEVYARWRRRRANLGRGEVTRSPPTAMLGKNCERTTLAEASLAGPGAADLDVPVVRHAFPRKAKLRISENFPPAQVGKGIGASPLNWFRSGGSISWVRPPSTACSLGRPHSRQ